MTTSRLREELQVIGDRAPVATVPVDIWSRARAARRRNLAGGVVAVAASVAVVAGLAFGVTGSDKSQPSVVDNGQPGVPDRIDAVPSDVTQREDDLAIGRGAAAFLTDDDVPVVIDATDGSYHLLDLPGATGGALVLSPDGELLAYAAATRVRVLDLSTGELRSDVDTSAMYTDPPEAEQLDFASGEGILVWAGADPTTSLSGRVVFDTDEPAPGDSLPDPDAVWAATEGGGFVGVGTSRILFHDNVNDFKRPLDVPGVPVAAHVDGTTVYDLRADDGTYRLYTHTSDGDTELQWPLSPQGELTVTGWLPDNRLVLAGDGRLMLVAAGDEASLTEVGEVATDGINRLTIATDLITDDQPTVDRPEPDWD